VEKQHAFTMFTGLIAAVPEKDRDELTKTIVHQIDWTRRVLRRHDRVVWWLRLARVAIAADFDIPFEDSRTQVNDDPNKPQILDPRFMDIFQRKLIHFMGLGADEIEAIVFDRQSLTSIIDEMEAIEQEWIIRPQGTVTMQPEHEILIQFLNGWAWIDLHTTSSRDEGLAMGHCGNAYGYGDDTIISLREPKDRARNIWTPHLTFILDKRGRLGETKAPGNSKPQPRRHPQILALLHHDRVRGIKGGGYLPETNFNLADLTQAQRDDLFSAKPSFLPLKEAFTRGGMSDDIFAQMQEIAAEHDLEGPMVWHKERDRVEVERFVNVDDLIDRYGNDTAEYAVKIANSDESVDACGWFSDSDASNALDDLPQETKDIIASWVIAQDSDGDGDGDGDAADMRDDDNFGDWIKEYADDILDAMRWSLESGAESGTEGEIVEDLKKALMPARIGSFTLVYEDTDGDKTDFVWDVPIRVETTPAALVDLLSDEESLYEMGQHGWIDEKIMVTEPYYGWNEMDEVYRDESFRDRLRDLGITLPDPHTSVTTPTPDGAAVAAVAA